MAAPSRAARFVNWLSQALPTVITLALAGIGAAAGFRHTHDWAVSNGQTGWFAWADAVVIECMCLVAGFEIHRDRKAERSARFPLTVLVVGFGIQMTAQVAEAKPTPAGWLLAATPALGFLVVVKLLMRRLPDHSGQTEDPDVPPTPLVVPVSAQRTDPVAAPAPANVTVPRVKLPPAMADRVTDLVAEIRAEGREPTAEDIRRAVKVPGPMAAQILDGLPPANPATRPTNGHAVI
jgi:uncharacterized protein DUF2637